MTTITSVAPASGLVKGGTIIDVAGTGFRTRSLVYEFPPLTQGPTARVSVNGVACRYTQVVSATLARAVVPPTVQNGDLDVFPAVAVSLVNLDDAGVEVPGSASSLASAFTYIRPRLGHTTDLAALDVDPPVQQVCRAFVRMLKRVIFRGVAIRTAPDYADPNALYTVLSPEPCLSLRVRMLRDLEGSQWDNQKVRTPSGDPDGSFLEWKPPRTYMIEMTILASAKLEGAVLRLIDGVLDEVIENPFLQVPADPRWAAGSNGYPMDVISEPEQVGIMGLSGMEAWEMKLLIKGVPIMPSTPESRVYPATMFYLAEAALPDGVFHETAIPL